MAELGHSASQFNLGYLYQHGLAVPANPGLAAQWYRAAAEQGRVEAQFSLGTLYETGNGVPRNLIEAYRWYNLAASNVPPGKSRDRLIRHRERVAYQLPETSWEAIHLAPVPSGFRPGTNLAKPPSSAPAPAVIDVQRALAARKFNPGALDGQMGGSTIGALAAFQASVGLPVTGELDPETVEELFGPEDVAPHLEPFPRAAAVRKEPEPPAVPVPPVEEIALAPYPAPAEEAPADETAPEAPPVELAEAPPAAPAQVQVLTAPEPVQAAPDAPPAPVQPTQPTATGSGTTLSAVADLQLEKPDFDPEKFRRLAEDGNASAQINLAAMYHYGQGVEENHAEAAKWYRRAAEQGRVDAMFPLGSLYETGDSAQRDLAEAHRWYSLAAEKMPAGRAHEIIVKRRDRVAALLADDQQGTVEVAVAPLAPSEPSAPSDVAAEEAETAGPEPVLVEPPNQAPTGFRFTALDGESSARSTAPFVVAENAAGGTPLGRVSATDPDADDILTYSLVEDAEGRFALDPASGSLAVAAGAVLDFEATSHHDLVVRVTDSAGLSHEEAVTVAVSDVNEAPWAETAALAVTESATAGTALGRISAGDPDDGANGALTYALTGEGPFAVDPASGEITLAEGARLDFETAPEFELAATVTDGGGLSARALVTVTLTNRNEAPSLVAANFIVAENAVGGTVLGKVRASDPDADGGLAFTLIDDAGGRFAIDGETGTLRVLDGAALDFETAKRHELLVRVADSGGLTHDETVTVTVSDLNETPTATAASLTVMEDVPGGTALGRITAADQDGGVNGSLTYALTDEGPFEIDPATGEVTLAEGARLDFEATPRFELTATATDGGGLSARAGLTIALGDVNERPWAEAESFSVPENAAEGTSLGRVGAGDPDAGDRLAFALTEDAGGRFAIDAETGALTVVAGAELDFETEASHELAVRVTDSGGLSDEKPFTVAVADLNETPWAAAETFAVTENAPDGTAIGDIRAGDPDVQDRLAFALADDADGRFAIDAESGHLVVADGAELDFETGARLSFTVTVTDEGGLSHAAPVTVELLDRNEPPAGLAMTGGSIAESAVGGTKVARLQASDPDAGDRVTYALTDDADGRFIIDRKTGVVSVAKGIVFDYDEAKSHEIAVQVTDRDGLGTSERLTLAVTNENFAPTGVTLTKGTVPENATVGTLVAKISADDPDADERLVYELIEDADGRFVIDAASGAIFVAEDARLDFENKSGHQLVVRVTDSGGLSHEEALAIAVTDMNEAPRLEAGAFELDEMASPGTTVGRLVADDPDGGAEGRLRYALAGDDRQGLFALDEASGVITVAEGADLDFETQPAFALEVTASDGGGLSDSARVAITLRDRNEAPHGLMIASSGVPETAPAGRLAGQVTGLDPDAGERLTYELTEDAGGRFVIDPETGRIRVSETARLDFERQASHRIALRVTDSGGLTHDESLTIAVTDSNEAPRAEAGSFELAELSPPGTTVGRVSVGDPDRDGIAGLRYAITGDDSNGRFAVDPESGIITVAEGADLDFEETRAFTLEVTATDVGGLSDAARIAIALSDRNEPPNGIRAVSDKLPENAARGRLAGQVTGLDPDAGDRLTYALTEDAGGRFVIDPDTGTITVAADASLDFEAADTHRIAVRVTDSGGLAYDDVLAIALSDINEAPSLEGGSFELDELARPGAMVGRLAAGDPDRGGRENLRFALTGDNSEGRFAVDPASGVITVAKGVELDFEDRPTFKLEVTATDNGGLSDAALVSVNLIDRNETPDAIRLVGGKVAENAVGGRHVGQVSALDPDEDEQLIYELSADAGGHFAIDGRTGAITVAEGADLDFEVAESHRVTVRVIDSGGLTLDKTFPIAVTDVNEAPTARGDSIMVVENTAAGAAVARLTASDPDADDRLTFGLTYNPGGRFAVDRDSGIITVAESAALDYEAGSSFALTATVVDSGGLKDTVPVVVEIFDLNEPPRAKVTMEGAVAENAVPGTLAATFGAEDPDLDDRVTFSLVEDAGGRFAIDPKSGLVTVARGAYFDYETAPEHQVAVRLTDRAGLSHEARLTIAVLDVDEAPVVDLAFLTDPGTASNGQETLAAPEIGVDIFGVGGGDGLAVPRATARSGLPLPAPPKPDLTALAQAPENGHGLARATGFKSSDFLGAEPGTPAPEATALKTPALTTPAQTTLSPRTAGLDKSDKIAALQVHLREAGFDPGPVDGKMDFQTRAALTQYQQAFKLLELRDEELLDHMLVRAHFRRGYKHQSQGDYDTSIEAYTEVVRLSPEHFSAYYNRGLSYYEKEHYEEAIADFGKVLGLQPEYAGAYINRGNAFYQQGSYGKALSDYLTAVGHWIWPW